MATKKTTEQKPEKSPLERAIASRERAIARMEQRKVDARKAAETECERIDKELAKSRVLLDAIKKGSLKV